MSERVSRSGRPVTPRNDCPNPACDRTKPRDKAFCLPCWRQIPHAVQELVYASYRSRDLLAHVDYLDRLGERLAAGVGEWPTPEPPDLPCPHPRCESDLQDADGLLICVGCGFVPEECDCNGCDCCDDAGHRHDDDTCFHPCCPDAGREEETTR